MPDPTSVIPASNPSKATATAKLQLHELHYNLGSILHQQGDLVGAAQNYQQTIALHPHHAIAHHHLAIVLDEQGQRDQAIDHYTQAIALRPASAELYNNLACALAKQGRVDEAIQAYEQAIALQPQWAKLYHNLAQVEYQRHPMVAIAHYRQAIALQPDFVAAHYHLGKSLQFQGQHAAAVACFQKVLALAPEHPYAQSDCGFSWMQQGQIETALICFRASIAQQPLMVQAYCDWAKGLTGTDELSLARVACGEFLQALLQQNSEVYDRLADTYFHLGNVLLLYGGTEQVHQAEIYYQKALHLQPERIDLYLKLADCLIHQKRCNAAILVYHTAIALQPQPRLYLQLGQVLEQNQELMGAIAYYRQALLAKGQAGSWKYMQLTSTKSLHPEWKEHPDRLNLDQNAPKIPAIPSQPPSPQPEPSSSIQHFYASTQDWFQAQGLAASDYCALRSRPLTPDSAASGLENIPSSSQPGEMPAPQCLQPLESPQTASCQGLNCASCLPKIFREFQPIHVGAGIYRCTPHTPPISRTPPLFTATIPQGKAWAVPQQNDWMICNAIAVLTPENHLLADVSRDYPGQLPGCENPGTHRAFRQTWTEAPEAIAGKVAVVAGLSGHNYFHWMVDILPRLEILRQSHWDWDAIDWFWINDDHRRFQQQTLQALGIPQDKILSSDRHPNIQAEQLIVPSFPGHLGWLEPWALHFLRQSFLPLGKARAQQAKKPLPRRLYISRDQAHHRRVLNEAAVIAQLEPFGFVPVQLEALDFLDQVALFSQAEVIIAPHGGGLTNTLFCAPGTTVIELVSPQYIRHYYWVISHLLGLNHYYVTSDEFNCFPLRQLMYPSPLTEDIWISPETLSQILQRIDLAD